MAKFHNYYVLCPLIDQKSFLGISHDKETEDVIVTLGRNVVNKYSLSDQKQVGGWTSKDHITSAVIYDDDQESYVGIFNNNTIKMWKEDSTNLDKIKKYKFPINILRLIPRQKQSPLVIFTDGNCASLQYAIDNRKAYESKPLIKDTDVITDIAYYHYSNVDYVCYIIKNSKDAYEIVNCPIRVELGDLERSKLSKTKITRDNVQVVGKLICAKKSSVFVLWSDAKMNEFDLNKKSWKTIGTVPWISSLSSVSLLWLGKPHLILFGSNIDQDGAIIVAYNISLGVGSCRYPMKMYSQDAKLYCFNNRIILEASNHIGVLPYVLETKRNLSNLLGSHEITPDEQTEIADWGTPTDPLFQVDSEIKSLLGIGLTERSICAQIIPPLLENDYRTVIPAIRKFKDIPESIMVMLLRYAIRLVNPNNVDLKNKEYFAKFCKEGYAKEIDKFLFLNDVFLITFSDALVIPHLRNGLTLNDTLFLMSYICYVLYGTELILGVKYESKLYDWCILLMDAFYQQLLMTKDEMVTNVLQNVLDVITRLVKQLETIGSLMPKLNKLLHGQGSDNDEKLSYAIELMQI